MSADPDSQPHHTGSPPAIEARNLSKTYSGTKGAPGVVALKNIDLCVPRGSIFGLLGPNGAGKSTFINILAGLVIKTQGTVKTWGFDLDDNPRQTRAAIGVVPQEITFDPFFSPLEALEMQAGLYGVPKAERHSQEILDALGLADKAHVHPRTLSGGMKRRLLIAKALVHNPPVLVLDEPTAGVDVELRHQLWDYVRTLHDQGVTIVLTTHYLEEAETLCDTIAIINHGEVVVCEPKADLMRRIDQKTLYITPGEAITRLPALDELGAGLRPGLTEDGRLTLVYKPSQHTIPELLDQITRAGITINDISIEETRLEDVFLELTR